MPTFYVPVAVKAETAEGAENFVEGLLKGRIPAELPNAELDWVGDAELQEGDATCQRCDGEIDAQGHCKDETCPYSDHQQSDILTEG